MPAGIRAAAARAEDGLRTSLTRGMLFVALAVLAWAILPIALKPAAEKVSAPILVFVRFLGGGLALTPWIAGQARRYEPEVWRRCRRSWRRGLLMILCGFAIPQVLFTWAIGRSAASVVSFLVYAYPCFSVLFAALILKERLSTRFRAGLALLVAGLFLVSLSRQGPTATAAEAMAVVVAPLLVSICWGASTVLTKDLLNAEIPSPLVAYLRIVGGTAVMLPHFLWHLLGRRNEIEALFALDGKAWGGLVFSAFVPVAIALPLYTAGLKTVPVRRASIVEAWTPMLTAVCAVFLFDEKVGWELWVGGVLIVGATVIATSRRSTNKARAA